MSSNGFKIISGSSNIPLTDDICSYILHEYDYPIKPVNTMLTKFSDGESRVEINENLRGYHVFVIQSLSNPVNDNLIELCLILDTLKRCNVSEVTVVNPFYGYARADKKDKPRTPISAKMVADIIQTCNLNRMVTIDLHSPQIQGYFNCPVDNLYASKVLLKHMPNYSSDELVIVSPDKGGVERASYYSKKLNCGLAFCYKHRDKPNEIAEMRLIGDVSGKRCVIVDDMADTCGTLVKCNNILKEKGAKEVSAFVTHGVLSGNGYDNLNDSCIDTVNITNTIKLPDKVLKNPKFNVINVDELISKCIINIYEKKSVSELFV